MFDCHAHAYPSLRYQVGRVSTSMPAQAADLADRGAAALEAAGQVVRAFFAKPQGREPTRGIEKLAEARSRRSERMNRLVESTLSAVAGPVLLPAGTLDNLIASMDRFGIDRTVLIGAPPIAPNDWLLEEAVAVAGDRIIPVPTLAEVDPAAPEQDWLDAYADLAARGAAGFKIHPNMDGLPPDHPAYRALFAVADESGLFVIVHTGCFHVPVYKDVSPSEPTRFEALYREFPSVRVCLAHMNREEPEAAWQLMLRHDQIFADTSWQPAEVVRRALDTVGSDRIVLGSDWPLLHTDLQGDALDIVRRATTDEELEQVCVDNARALIGDA